MTIGAASEPPFRRRGLWQAANAPRLRTARNAVLGGAVVGVVLAIVVGLLVVGQPAMFGDDYTRPAHARWLVRRLANEQFPAWRASHPDQLCPDRLSDLDDTVLDPWGHALEYTCDPRLLPAASSGIAITSTGEDGTFATDDDIGSEP